MSKRPSKRTSTPLYEWRIIRTKKTPAALVGYVNAPDKEEAIKKAIASFGVKDPQQQSPVRDQGQRGQRTILAEAALRDVLGHWHRQKCAREAWKAAASPIGSGT